MNKFLLGVLVTVAYYNQAAIMRTYYKAYHEFKMASHAVQVEPTAPAIDTRTEVKEPSLETLSGLGFLTINATSNKGNRSIPVGDVYATTN